MTTRTPPTQERKDAAKARRKEITAGFAALDPEARARLVARVGAVMQPNGHTLSMTNTCLALFQRADVSLVAGLHDWRKSGRKVKTEYQIAKARSNWYHVTTHYILSKFPPPQAGRWAPNNEHRARREIGLAHKSKTWPAREKHLRAAARAA